MNKLKLHNYQKKAVDFVINKKKCALFLEMGLGKTLISLKSIQYFIEKKFVKKVLIVAPLKVANTVWKQELTKWNEFNKIIMEICTGTLQNRKNILEKKFDILVINIENLIWLLKNHEINWDMLVIDESSIFKNYKSKRFKFLKKIITKFKSIVLLTGTPCPNNYLDLWSQLYLIDNGLRLEKNITNYKNKYFVKTDYMGYCWDLKKDSSKKIKCLIKDVCLSMSLKDHIKLKQKKHLNYYAKFPDNIEYIYKTMEKKFFLEIEKQNVTAISAAACANKLLQMCNGFIYDDDKNTILIHNEKIKLLNYIMKKYENNNFLISYNFKSDLKYLKKNFPNAITLTTSGEEINDWNKKKIKILLAHPLSSCYGLNAQHGGNIIIWYGMTWSLQNYMQFNSRVYRLGQTNSVKIINLIMKGGLDEKIIKVLQNKNLKQNELLKTLKLQGEKNE